MINLFIGVLIFICIWLASQALKHSAKNFHLETELEIYKDFDRANRTANKVLRERNCELVDQVNALESQTDIEMDLLESLGYREEDIRVLEADNKELKDHLQKAMDWIIRLQESKYGITMLPVIPFLRPDLVTLKSYTGLFKVEEDPKKLFECHHGLIDLVRIKPTESDVFVDDDYTPPLQWGEKEALHWANKFYGDKPF